MPKSRVRSKPAYTPPPTRSASKRRVSPPWLVPTMLGFFFVGIAWLVVYYVTGGDLPVKSIENWNLAVGFGAIIVGFGFATQWR